MPVQQGLFADVRDAVQIHQRKIGVVVRRSSVRPKSLRAVGRCQRGDRCSVKPRL